MQTSAVTQNDAAANVAMAAPKHVKVFMQQPQAQKADNVICLTSAKSGHQGGLNEDTVWVDC